MSDQNKSDNAGFGDNLIGAEKGKKNGLEPKVFGIPRTAVLMAIMLLAGLGWVFFARAQVETKHNVKELQDKRDEISLANLQMEQVVDGKQEKAKTVDKLLKETKVKPEDTQVALKEKVETPFDVEKITKDPEPETQPATQPSTQPSTRPTTQPATKPIELPSLDKFRVTGISGTGKTGMAMISNRFYKIGDKLNGWEIVEIKPNEVVLKFKDFTKKLRLRNR